MTESLAELKTTQEEQADLVRRYVDEYAALALEADRIKQRMDWLKGQFETLATGALKDTKLLSISYWQIRENPPEKQRHEHNACGKYDKRVADG